MKKIILLSCILIALLSGCVINPYNYTAFYNNFNHAYETEISLNFSRGTSPKIEIAVSPVEGSLDLLIINPKGENIFSAKMDKNMVVQKSFDFMHGVWKVALKSDQGSGNYSIKFHDKTEFEGF